MADLGIRRETKNRWERRAPLTPDHVAELVREQGLSVAVQPAPLRVFPDEDYRAAGADVREDLSDCRIVLGVKEVPPELLLDRKPYLFFSHVIKGQPSNMPLLRALLDRRCTLMDYERIVDRHGRRLIFFGRHAGFAGMIDALWAYGRRLASAGLDTAFADVRPAHAYRSVDEAADALARGVGRRIREHGLHPDTHPFVAGFTGGGNVSQGAQEVFERLPAVEIHPDELPEVAGGRRFSRHAVYKVVFRREHRREFERHLPYLTMLVNGIYWEPGQPRLVSRAALRALWARDGSPKLAVIADLSCDVDGSIEATVRVTDSDAPVYVYDPDTGEAIDGVEGRGPVILAVDNLPAELPRDASEHFGDSLYPFVQALTATDYGAEFEFLSLPAAVLHATVTHAGELTPRYRYLEQALREAGV